MKTTIILCSLLAFASLQAAEVSFSGYADADFAGGFSDTSGGSTGFENPSYMSGLEIDLTTHIKFDQAVSFEIYTTMVDGAVPAQGAGNTWPKVAFDGAALLMNSGNASFVAGDMVIGAGQFTYYLHKRSYAVVPETYLRGAGVNLAGVKLYSGMNTPAKLYNGTNSPGTATTTWSTFLQYSWNYQNEKVVSMTASPLLYYTAGVPGRTPFIAGMEFAMTYRDAVLNGSGGLNGDGKYDTGYRFLVEPSISLGKVSLAGAAFMQDGGDVPSENVVLDKTLKAFDDTFFYFEPGYSISDEFAFGLPLEWHDPDKNITADDAFWIVPTFYVYPAENVEWWLWAQAVLPNSSADPEFYFGSEIIASF